jgi:hypothetical protein
MIRSWLRSPVLPALIFTLSATARASTVSYCLSAPNSVGSGAHISWAGPVTTHGPHSGSLIVRGCPANAYGVFIYGQYRDRTLFGDGYSCIGGANWRLARKYTAADGTVTLNVRQEGEPEDLRWLNYHYHEAWYFQYLYRDVGGPGGTGLNLTDGLEVHFES